MHKLRKAIKDFKELAGEAPEGSDIRKLGVALAKIGEALARAQHPAHPAIPEEVRKAILKILKYLHDADEDRLDAEIDTARDWLAKCPQATDKAVCPKCGKECEQIDVTSRHAHCLKCMHRFPVQVLVISPPREPKETP